MTPWYLSERLWAYGLFVFVVLSVHGICRLTGWDPVVILLGYCTFTCIRHEFALTRIDR